MHAMNRYEALAHKIEEKIRTGVLLSGEKLPSIRELSAREQASPATVVEAYELLKDRGLVEARNRSGIYVANIQSPPLEIRKSSAAFAAPASLNPEDLIQALRQAIHNPRIFPFGAAAPMPDFFPVKALNRCITQALRDEPALISEYRFPPGAESLRTQIAKHYARHGLKLDTDAVVTTGGAIEAIGMALSTVAKPGDIVAVETPAYFGILQLLKLLSYKILEIPLDPDRGLTPERFREALKKSTGRLKALVTVANFSNPLGTLVADEDKQMLVQLANAAGVTIIEDDIYGDLGFDTVRPLPLKAFDTSDTVILCGSFAKTISPALRVGYAYSKKHAKAITLHKAVRTSGVTALAEDALALYLAGGHYERHLRRIRREYRTLTAQYSSAILAHFPEGTRVSNPAGGFILWVQLPGKTDSRQVQRKGLEQSISVAPGPIFSASHKDYTHYIRINCAIPWSIQAQRAVQKLAKIVEMNVSRG
jgi:DNA-binding transcriptional MocR family regulator